MDFDSTFSWLEGMAKGHYLENYVRTLKVCAVITGEGGGVISAEGDRNGIRLFKGERPGAVCTLTVDSQDLEKLLTGRLKPMSAFMTGKVKTSGDVMSVANAMKYLR